MLEGPVWDTVRAWCLADFETADGIFNLHGVGQHGFACSYEYARKATSTVAITAGSAGSATG